jgi:hypothetical protein
MNPLSQDPSRNLVIMKALTPVTHKSIINDPDLRIRMPLVEPRRPHGVLTMLECLEGRYKSPSNDLSADPYRWPNPVKHKVAYVEDKKSVGRSNRDSTHEPYWVSPTCHRRLAMIFYLT